jgi:NADPH-dependent 2,4-dienoyl-CoA reductase/sulfur reductase-like enzyme
MRSLDPELGAHVHAAMERMGIEVRTATRVVGFEDGRILLEEGSLPADLVVLGIGVGPNAELAVGAGIATGAGGAIAVDRRQRTGTDGVWAAGDCAESFHLVAGHRVHLALGTIANKQGRVAGINLGGGYATFAGVVGTAVTRICELEIARTGLHERQADEAGYAWAAASIESTTRAGYFPGAEPMTVKLLAERGSGKLLGGQIVGGQGSAKRIDVLATALHARMTVAQLAELDLGYAPPFSSVWDPVQQAAWATLRALAA